MTMHNNGLCSVCCVGYKHDKFLEDCIQSIWNNDYKNIEIIALDDGSEDGSIDKLKLLQTQSPCPFIIIDQEHTGNIAQNCNTTCSQAKGEFILFISLDDILLENAISEKMKIMNYDKNIMFVANSQVLMLEKGKIKKHHPELLLDSLKNPKIDDLLELEYNKFGSFYVQTAIFRKYIVDCVGGFDNNMVGDDIILRTKIFLYMKKNYKYSFRIIYSPSLLYRIHDSNIHKNSIRQLQTVIQYCDKYWRDREYPDILKEWLFHALNNNSFFDALKIFTFSPKASHLLLDQDVQKFLYISAIKKFINDNKSK